MRTVRAAFGREADAAAARDSLLADGIEPQRVSILNRSRAQRMPTGADTAKGRGLWANIKDMVSVPDEPRAMGDASLKQGGYLLTVSVAEDKLEGVIALLSKSGVVEFDEDDHEASEGSAADRGNEIRVPVGEERLTVGIHAKDEGGIRATSHIAEQPVHGRVHLYDYRVSIERRAVDRAAGANDHDPLEDLFRERVIEMTETTDEVRFIKEARVREEIVIRKEVHQRTEEVDTTLRHTEVDIQKVPTATSEWSSS